MLTSIALSVTSIVSFRVTAYGFGFDSSEADGSDHAQDRSAWRGAIDGELLNAKRPKRAAAVETNRRMDAMLADGHALMSNASILASRERAAEKPLGDYCLAPKRWRGGVYIPPGGRQPLADSTNVCAANA